VLRVEYAGGNLARYDVEYHARTNRLRQVKKPRLFETARRRGNPQPRLFELAALGEGRMVEDLEDGRVRTPKAPAARCRAAGAIRLRLCTLACAAAMLGPIPRE
jgi:hypothetical protein